MTIGNPGLMVLKMLRRHHIPDIRLKANPKYSLNRLLPTAFV
jgi:hypothetical protein